MRHTVADLYTAARADGVSVATAARLAAMMLPAPHRPHQDWRVERDLAAAIIDGELSWLQLDPPCSPRSEDAARAWFAAHLGSDAIAEIEQAAAGG